MKNKVHDFCIENKLLEKGDRVLVGLSGGADSVCLLFALLDMQKELKLDILAVHVHHGIRGEEADRDEAFCKALCEKQRVAFRSERIDAPALAAATGDSLEEAGRKARYEIFNRIAGEEGYNKIAVAHHKNDQAETVLFQLIRGSRVAGLAGIRPQNGCVIRPLLCVTRKEIEGYLKENTIDYVTDSTNLENDASRNVFRNEVIPMLNRIQPEAVNHICETADYMRRVEIYLEHETDRLYEAAATETEGRTELDIRVLQAADTLIAEKAVYRALCRLSGRKKDITHRHVESALELMVLQTGSRIDFKYGITGEKAFERLIFTEKNRFDIDSSNCNNTRNTGGILHTCIFLREEGEATQDFIKRAGGFGTAGSRKLLDMDELQKVFPGADRDSMEGRLAEAGDYIVVFQDGRRKKVFDVLMEAGLPGMDRGRVPVAAIGTEVFLIKGIRGCEHCRITDSTKRILLVEFK